MTAPESESKPIIQRILSSRLGIIALLLVFLLLAILSSLPYGIDYGIRDWLASQGAPYVKIEDIDFNPFSGKIRVKNLRSGKDDAPHLQIGDASLTIAWKPMLQNRFYFDEIVIKDSLLSIRQKADGKLVIGGLKQARPDRKKTGDKPAGFGAGSITILNSKISYQSEKLRLSTSIKRTAIGALASWQPEKAAQLEFSGVLENGQVSFTGEMRPFAEAASVAGKLETTALSLAPVNAFLDAAHYAVDGTIDTEARIRLVLSGSRDHAAEHTQHEVDGDITLHDVSIHGADKQPPLWNSKTVHIKGIHAGPQAAGETSPTEATALNPGHVSIKSVKIENMTASLHRGVDGRWLVIQDILEKSAATADKPPTGLTFSIDEVTVEGDSSLVFEDEVVTPVFREKLAIEQFRAARIDSRQPQQASDLQLTGKIGEYTDVSLGGKLQLFSKQLNLDMQGKIGKLDMPPLSPYSQHYLGYVINSGYMDADLQAKVVNDEIEAEYGLKAGNPQVTIVDQDKSQPLAEALNMPLGTALNVLRDKNKDVELKIAMTGNIHDPEFDFSDAINQAIGKAVRTAALGYLKFSLGPFGALITLGQLAGEAAAHISLEPIKFAPGQAVFDAIDLDYMQRLAGLLDKRPELRIRVCGTAVASDLATLRKTNLEADQDTLQLLAKTRAEAVKEHLVSQHAVTPERLFVCLPEAAPDSDAPPQVKLML